MYRVILSKSAARNVEGLDQGYREKLREVLEQLQINPFSYPYKKLKGETNLYRIRIGKYRIIYEIEKEQELVIILKIDERSKVYR